MQLLPPIFAEKTRGLVCTTLAFFSIILLAKACISFPAMFEDCDHICEMEWRKQEEAKAREWIRREPNNANAHIHLSGIYNAWYLDFKGQAKELRIAAKLRPHSAEIYNDLTDEYKGIFDDLPVISIIIYD